MNKQYYYKIIKKFLKKLRKTKNAISELLFEELDKENKLVFCYELDSNIIVDMKFKKKIDK